jgi:hypothetical protein
LGSKASLFKTLILILLTASCAPSTAQLAVSAKVHRGFIFSHTPYISGLVQSHFNIYELTFSKFPNGKKYWHAQYPHAYWGISYITSNLGYPQVLGNVHAILPHFNFPIAHRNKYLLTFQLGTGVGYFTKTFNRTTNYKNLAIGSHVTINMRGMFESKFTLNPHWQVVSSLGINHFSNAAFKTPNYGLNILSAMAGINYTFNKPKDTTNFAHKNTTTDALANKWYTTAIVSAARKQTSPAGGKNYYVGALQLSVCKQITHKYRLGAGLEYNYNTALQRDVHATDLASLSRIMIGVHNEFLIHRLSIVSVTGVNLYSKAKSDGYIMNRLGLRYYFKNKLIANVSLKTHLGQADFFDVGVGYAF